MTRVLGIVKEGMLIPEGLWLKFINGLENSFDALETNKERAKRELAYALVQAIKRRIVPKFGILFSGGVDSSLIAFISKQLKCNFTCYTVGIEGSDDIVWAQKAANEYKLNFKCKLINLNELETILKNVIKMLNTTDIVKISVGSVLYAAGRAALRDGNIILFSGLGSEEIFAGYQRHETALQNTLQKNNLNNFEALHKECWNGLRNMWNRDLARDHVIAKALGLDLRTPFLDKDLVKLAMSIHPMFKLDKDNKKIILRETAEFIGLKMEFAWRKKQAAQYGSDFANGIDKLARRNGFKYKKDYLQKLCEVKKYN